MRISTIGYQTKQGFKNIGRKQNVLRCVYCDHGGMYLPVWYILFNCTNFRYMVQKAEEGVAITVFFDEEATDAQIKKIGDELKSQNGVLKVNFVSADEAWDSFKDEYFGDAKELADGFKDDNPLSGSDNYEVYMSDVSKQKDVVSYAEKLDGVSKVNKSDVVAKTLTSVNRLIYYVSIVLIGILLCSIHLPDQ